MTMRRRNPSRSKVRQSEFLESRNLLAGHGFGGGFSQFAAFGPQFAGAPASAFAQMFAGERGFGVFSSGSSTHNQGTTLTAQLSDPNTGATGTATYRTYTENGETETEFKVSVTGATVSTTLDVTLGGIVVGQIKTDTTGAGTLKLSSDPGTDEQPLPDGFPTNVAVDTDVAVGTIAGALAASNLGHGGCGGGGGTQASVTRLTAALADASSSATGTASFKSGTRDGATVTKLTVSVTGATADSTLDVTVGTTVIGQVKTDSTGAGKTVFSSNPTGDQQSLPTDFPTDVAAGTMVSVGSVSGAFATATATEHQFGHFHRHR